MPSESTAAPRSLLRYWAQLFAIWTIPAILATTQLAVFSRNTSHPIPIWRAFLADAPAWYAWAIVTPVIVRLGQAVRIDRRITARALSVHIVAAVLSGLLYATVDAVASRALGSSTGFSMALLERWYVGSLQTVIVVYFGVLGISYALINTQRLRARERHAEQLAAELAAAQLTALRAQLQPHFLFNSLNSVMGLVRDQQIDAAIDALSLLSDVLRATLRTEQTHEVPLDEEVDFIRRYLSIEQLRFGHRLRVHVDVPEALRRAAVPPFLLQPLVENALRHGVLPERAGGSIAVRAAAHGSGLTLAIVDDGGGLSDDWERRAASGIGIASTRARLAHLYGSEAELCVERRDGVRGVEARVRIPLRLLAERLGGSAVTQEGSA
jgi:two-component system LytT family sensor kinase